MVLPPISQLTWSEFLLLMVIVTLLLEFITVVLRFICNIRAETSLAFLGFCTGGYRVHHLFIGVFVCLFALSLDLSTYWDNTLLIVGSALIVSDLVHHFLILWPLTGAHEFHLKYPSDS